ncbi:uncharacterized protein N7511_011546 [Penicillium nucicola]|uniref:uncharacterized protein n=1 Tax=Penicillium nucicola TaxID=1850975 RepID=UPI0025457A01|nr:uncharacterized protein N7511_011546 [Penicillium nucicola]KAJ5742360.1 hypothetical protein N7511_011546 [Penicillium nucicola]
MRHLQIAGWSEYEGPALVQYDLISFHPEKRKFLLKRDVEIWKKKLEQHEGELDKVVHAPIVMVSKEALQKAETQSCSRDNGQEIPTLIFGKGELLCLDGQSRIKAFKNSNRLRGCTGFGIVHIVLDDIVGAKRDVLLKGYLHQITPNSGRLYPAIRGSENFERRENTRLKSILSDGKQRNLKVLSKCDTLSGAFDKVLLSFPAMAYALQLGSIKTYHATLCEVSIKKYLVDYVFGFWSEVVAQTQAEMDGFEILQTSDIPSEVFETLQGMMPGVSEDEYGEMHDFFSHPTVLEGFSEAWRMSLKETILQSKSNCMIPSMKLFGAHMVFLENISICMRELLELGKKQVKRGHGCSTPLEMELRRLYTAEMNLDDEYYIQTINGWRSIRAPFEERQELSCRQLWLFVMREGTQVDKCHLAYTAKRLGFSSNLIETRAADYVACEVNRGVMLHPSNWADLPTVTVKQRLGQKGNRWSERSNSAKKYLFFDLAETIGTESAQNARKLKGVTTLVELACIYRAFFGHPFRPSTYAEPSPTSEVTRLSPPTARYSEVNYPSLSSVSPRGQDASEIVSPPDDDWRAPSLVIPSTPLEKSEEYIPTARDASKPPSVFVEASDDDFESLESPTSACSGHKQCGVGECQSYRSSSCNRDWREPSLVIPSTPLERSEEYIPTARDTSKPPSVFVETSDDDFESLESLTSAYSGHKQCGVGEWQFHRSSSCNREVSMPTHVGGNCSIRHLNSIPIEVPDHAQERNGALASLSLLPAAEGDSTDSQNPLGISDPDSKHIWPLNSEVETEGRVIAENTTTNGRNIPNDHRGWTQTIVTTSPTSWPLQLAQIRAEPDQPPTADKSIEKTTDQDRLTAQITGGHSLCALDKAEEAGQRQQVYLQERRAGRESEEKENNEATCQWELYESIEMGSPISAPSLGDDEHYRNSMSLFAAEPYSEDEGQMNDTDVVNSGDLECEFEGTEPDALLLPNAIITSPVRTEISSPVVSVGEKAFPGEDEPAITGSVPHTVLGEANATHEARPAPPAKKRPLTAEGRGFLPVRSQSAPPGQKQAICAKSLDLASNPDPVVCNTSLRTRLRRRDSMEILPTTPGPVGNEGWTPAPERKEDFHNPKNSGQFQTKTTARCLPQGQVVQDGALRPSQVPQSGRQVDGMDAVTHSKWQQPSVGDAENAGSKYIMTPVDGLVGNSPKLASLDIHVEAVIPTAPQAAEQTQFNGVPEGNGMTTWARMRRSVSGLAAPESWYPEEHNASQRIYRSDTKRRKSRASYMSKRPCIEISAAARLSKTPTRTMLPQTRTRAEAKDYEVYGPKALAMVEEMVRFSQGSTVLQSEKNSTEPISRQDRNPLEPLRTRAIREYSENSKTTQETYKTHGKRWKSNLWKFKTNKRPCIEVTRGRTVLGKKHVYGLQAKAATEEMKAFLKTSREPQSERSSTEPVSRQRREPSNPSRTSPVRNSVETPSDSTRPYKAYGKRWKSRLSKFKRNKRPCIENQAARPVNATAARAFEQPTRQMEMNRRQVYGLQEEAATEEMKAFLKRSRAPQSERSSTEPVSQQCSNSSESSKTGPALECVETPSASLQPNKDHGKRRNPEIPQYETNKRLCIKNQAARPVNATIARAFRRPMRQTEMNRRQVYGLQAEATTEMVTAFLQRSRLSQSEHNSTEPVSPQFRACTKLLEAVPDPEHVEKANTLQSSPKKSSDVEYILNDLPCPVNSALSPAANAEVMASFLLQRGPEYPPSDQHEHKFSSNEGEMQHSRGSVKP